ncbi:MAG TPA: aminoglycoside phosphotransferase family protein, partial [Solirubrobacterales bacterium]|nr:aminoglycoside phosphotransferase family protein [Solirubrobacterales bacterium]
WRCLDEGARLAKPEFLHDPAREPAVYAALADLLSGPPRYFGAVVEADRHWLFVEWVEGRELYQVGEPELWCAVASWLGEMHATLLPQLERLAGAAPLLEHDVAYHRRWLQRAIEFRGDGAEGRGIARLAECHEAVIEALLALPRTLIHGEFYASNVLVAGAAEPRIAPVDWEMAAIAPGLTDLAALVSGGWEEDQRAAIVAAYASGSGDEVDARALDFARLQLAIQWLGWAPPAWEPPPGQRHDWLGEALSLAEKLGL